MSDTAILTTDARGIARLVMNRPAVKNAFNDELIAAITDAATRAGADPKIRALVITGAGAAFSAGGDLSMMQRAGAASDEENAAGAARLAAMMKTLRAAPKPVIALVNGATMGGGVGLVAACDIAIASESAFFALSEARLGLIPAVISPYVVAAIGERQARRFFLTAERFDAETARRIGLVHMVCADVQLEATLEAVIANILAGGPMALGQAKELIAAVAGAPIDDALIADTARRIARARASAEGKEGIAAFLEKRKPNWMT